ncbi:MAG: DUF370 domain-containing protein [Clostridia bacterium]|nr:DUF370 domain-containing protein [Clostridia bacterium]
MKLYLNDHCAVEKDDIVGFFDMDTATVAPGTREFLRLSEREGRTSVTTGDIPVSFAVTRDKKNKIFIYFTRNAPKVLRRRVESNRI